MSDENVNAVPPEPEATAPDELEPESVPAEEIESPPAEEVSEPVAPPEPPGAPVPPEPMVPPSAPIPPEPMVPPVYPPPPPPPPGAEYAPPPATEVRGGAAEKNKLVAGILGILLGGLGIHKFYLGYTNEGIIMLAVSLVGGFVTFGAASGVVSLIGLIEGVIYLFKTDQEFNETYVVGAKKWF